MFVESSSLVNSLGLSLENALDLSAHPLKVPTYSANLLGQTTALETSVKPLVLVAQKQTLTPSIEEDFSLIERIKKRGSMNVNTLGNDQDFLTGLSASNKGNNESTLTASSTVINAPDLVVSNIGSPTSAIAGNTLSFKVTVKNQGNATAAASTAGVYLSQDGNLDSNDQLLGTVNNTQISSNKTNTQTFTKTLDSAINAGNYYLLVKADNNSVVTESNENNNVSAKALAIAASPQPDLQVNNLDVTSILDNGTNVKINYQLNNSGGTTASASTTKFFLSNDTVFDSLDTQLGTDNVGSLTAGASQNRSVSYTLSSPLTAGNYYIFAQADSNNTVVESNEGNNLSSNILTVSTLTDWCAQVFQDAELQSLATSLLADYNLSRQDMMDFFTSSKDVGLVDATEFNDLQDLVSQGQSLFAMPEYVFNLSNKVVNGDTANTMAGIGNLTSGSSDTQMTDLVNKWFLGQDRPDTTYTYQYVQGNLFKNGTAVNDIKQGVAGDCYFLTTLSAIAQDKPSYLQEMFIDNGDDTFTVKFKNNGVNEYVTVDRYLPTNGSGNLVYASYGSNYTNTGNELWVALAEKAYAQLAESGWSRPNYNSSYNTNSYAALDSGWMDLTIQQITGLATVTVTLSQTTTMTANQLINLVNSNQLLTVGFVNGDGGGLVVNNHAYTITTYNSTNQTFYLDNPWGTKDAQLTWDQLVSLQGFLQYTTT
ncbi:MAG: CARDB domain-containing protein [Microcystaceae cyanobacterium]